MGCVFSEAAAWLAGGYRGLLDYRQQRTSEINRILQKNGDYFHDDDRALQCVLDGHAYIEDRLQKSDNITKDVLDTMVDEMLWDEDRPNAKALSRKAKMILARAFQRHAANSVDNFSRTSSSRSHPLSLPRTAPPRGPLPEVPGPNVNRWRNQINLPQIHGSSESTTGSEIMSPSSSHCQKPSSGSLSEYEVGSINSWTNRYSLSTSPTSSFSSPHTCLPVVPPKSLSRARYSYGSNTLSSSATNLSTLSPAPLSEHPAYSHFPTASTVTAEGTIDSPPVHNFSLQSTILHDEARTIILANRAESDRHSTDSSQQIDPSQWNSSKHNGGISLFPTSKWSSAHSRRSSDRAYADNSAPLSAARSSITSNTIIAPPLPDHRSVIAGVGYLSIDTCIEWKRTHKKVKKNAKIPPLPGAHTLDDLNGRDHVLIIDDGASMASAWPDVKRVF